MQTWHRQAVEIGGTALDAVVLGDGVPTVVFVNGLGSPLEEWALVAPAVAARCRAVCYDRRPAPATGQIPVHDAGQMVSDLRALLDALGVVGPLVLVGHSWGGAVIRCYAREHPGQVAGMVYVDATHEGLKGMIPTRASRALYDAMTLPLRLGPVRRRLLRMLGFDALPPEAAAAVAALPWLADGRTSRAEYAGIARSLPELARTAPDLPPVPTRVLLAGGRGDWVSKLGARQVASIRAVWEQAVADRPDVTVRTVALSGHYISLDQPAAVIAAVLEVAEEVVAGAARA